MKKLGVLLVSVGLLTFIGWTLTIDNSDLKNAEALADIVMKECDASTQAVCKLYEDGVLSAEGRGKVIVTIFKDTSLDPNL